MGGILSKKPNPPTIRGSPAAHFTSLNIAKPRLPFKRSLLGPCLRGALAHIQSWSRNAGIIFKMMMASTDNPIVFSHGGSRRGPSYTLNKENNIRILLAKRLGKSVSTINKYLNHSEFLKSEAMQALVSAEIGKEFFEAIQPYKRKVIASLKSAQKSENEKFAAVSETIVSLLPEYQANRKTAITYDRTGQNESSSTEKQILKDEGSEPVSKPKEFMHWNGNLSAAEESPPTEDDVRREIKAVGSELMKIIENKDLSAHQMAEIVSSQIVRLAKLIQQLKQLDNLNTEKMEVNNNG